MTLSKYRKEALSKFDVEKSYSLEDASKIVKDITKQKFDSTVDLAVKLGVDPRKANQMVRGTVSLPHGTGKDVKVLVLCSPDKEKEATDAGADFVGLDEYIDKIKQGWTDVDVIITMPSVMGKVGALGRILGPRGLMPNPKVGTVTPQPAKAVEDAKAGQVQYRTDKGGVIHCTIGRASFTITQLEKNLKALMDAVNKSKPEGTKGIFIKKLSISSTMGLGVRIEQ